MPNLNELIKKIALDAYEHSKPVAAIFGEVISINPLKIQVDQKLVLNEAQLILTRNVTDYYIDIDVDHTTEMASAHSHQYKGKKSFLVHAALIIGENVIMMRQQGGQKFVVIDRAVSE